MKGVPPVSELSLLDRGKGVVIDEMHGGYLGVAKLVLTNWKRSLSSVEVSVQNFT